MNMEQGTIDNMKVKLSPSPSGYQPELQRKLDGYILHFLKELPAWCILALLVGMFMFYFKLTNADFIPRIIDGLVGGLLTSLVGAGMRSARQGSQQTDIKAQNIESANTESGDVVLSNPGSEAVKDDKGREVG